MQWEAAPGVEAEYSDYPGRLTIVDDAQPFDREVAGLDLSQSGYMSTVEDDGNPLLGELEEDDA